MLSNVKLSVFEDLAKLDGMMKRDEGEYLAYLATQVPIGGTIVQIGSYRGKSTCYLGIGLMFAENEKAKLKTIDLWTLGQPNTKVYHTQETVDIFYKQITKIFNGIPDFLEALMMRSMDAVKQHKGPIDLLVIDGCHTYKHVHADYVEWSKFIPRGGYIAFHDYVLPKEPDIVKVVDEIVKPSGDWDFYNLTRRLWSAKRIK